MKSDLKDNGFKEVAEPITFLSSLPHHHNKLDHTVTQLTHYFKTFHNIIHISLRFY